MQVILQHANHDVVGSTWEVRRGLIADEDVFDRMEEIRYWVDCSVPANKLLDLLSRDPHTSKKIGVLDSRTKRKVSVVRCDEFPVFGVTNSTFIAWNVLDMFCEYAPSTLAVVSILTERCDANGAGAQYRTTYP